MQETELLAQKLYETYCNAVGGKAFNGDALPNWITFRADPLKKLQSDAWIEVAREAIAEQCVPGEGSGTW